MTEEIIHKQKFLTEQWPTTGVTLYPTRASIVRQIKGVELKSGLNELTIPDLSLMADPDSVRVSGTVADEQPARINDLTIDMVPNKKSPSQDDEDDDEDDDEETPEPASLISAQDKVDTLSAERGVLYEQFKCADKELDVLEKYIDSLASNTNSAEPTKMKEALEFHAKDRETYWTIKTDRTKQIAKIDKDLVAARSTVTKERKLFDRGTRQARLDKEKKKAERAERKAEKDENKAPYMPNVYRVRITIELPETYTKSAEHGVETTLTLTYTTSSASWTPHYDLRLDTTNPALSTLTYRAHFTNTTCETWSQAAITLSTSQASFGGLGQKVPKLEKWRVTAWKGFPGTNAPAAPGENGTYSLAEMAVKNAEMLAYASAVRATPSAAQTMAPPMWRPQMQQMQQAPMIPAPSIPQPSGLRSAHSSGAHRSAPSAPPPPRGVNLEAYDPTIEDSEVTRGGDLATLIGQVGALSNAVAGADSYGLTTTYELPTPRTIPSSALVRRHVIAEISLSSLIFTYILIPKLQPAAFLKAKLTNTSGIPLLAGQAGLTLDGSFLGNLSFPRCAPTESIELALGVDQGVKVEYDRPAVKHATQGMMFTSKEEVGAFKRSMRITNSKSSAVSLVVLDQVPVSEQEDKLKVVITNPKGLKDPGDVVKNVGRNGKVQPNVSVAPASPVNTSDTSSVFSTKPGRRDSAMASLAPFASSVPSNTPWGTAKAAFKENGEIRWDVDLLKGASVSLTLEWECRLAGGLSVQALS